MSLLAIVLIICFGVSALLSLCLLVALAIAISKARENMKD